MSSIYKNNFLYKNFKNQTLITYISFQTCNINKFVTQKKISKFLKHLKLLFIK